MDRKKQNDGWMDRKMDGYKNGWMDRKNRCMVRWIHYFNVWIEQKQVNSWKDEKKIIYKKRWMVGWIEKKYMNKQMEGFHIHNYLLYITYPFIIHT